MLIFPTKYLYSRFWILVMFRLTEAGYLVRIRINFIPAVSDMALVNGSKGLVRN